VLFPAEVLPTVSVLAQGVHFLLALPVLLARSSPARSASSAPR
jgi:hypothetical protein